MPHLFLVSELLFVPFLLLGTPSKCSPGSPLSGIFIYVLKALVCTLPSPTSLIDLTINQAMVKGPFSV